MNNDSSGFSRPMGPWSPCPAFIFHHGLREQTQPWEVPGILRKCWDERWSDQWVITVLPASWWICSQTTMLVSHPKIMPEFSPRVFSCPQILDSTTSLLSQEPKFQRTPKNNTNLFLAPQDGLLLPVTIGVKSPLPVGVFFHTREIRWFFSAISRGHDITPSPQRWWLRKVLWFWWLGWFWRPQQFAPTILWSCPEDLDLGWKFSPFFCVWEFGNRNPGWGGRSKIYGWKQSV